MKCLNNPVKKFVDKFNRPCKMKDRKKEQKLRPKKYKGEEE